MSMPSRWATCHMVSPGRAATTLPSMVKRSLSVMSACSSKLASRSRIRPLYYRSGSPAASLRLVGEMLHRRDEGIGSRLAKTTDRGIAHGLGKFVEQLCVPLPPFEQSNRLVASDAAGRTLAAGFILEEPQEVQDHGSYVVTVGEDDDGMASDKTAVFIQSSEIEG